MNILYIAYSCAPNKGSEERIGWNVPLESAKTNKVYVVTKEEHRQAIEEYVRAHNIENPKFFFVDINNMYKKLFKGSIYSIRLNFWHKKALPIVREICKKERIDVIHQITPIEFRSVGDYAKIKNTPFVCGPMGGGESLPVGLKSYAKGNMVVEHFRNFLNKWSHFKYKISKKLSKSKYVLFANEETRGFVSDLISNVDNTVFPEVGINLEDISVSECNPDEKSKFTMLIAGRLVYRKGHSLLLDVLKELPDEFDYCCRIVGEGPEKEKLKAKCRELRLQDKVVFTGRIPFENMASEYKNADVFIMPSIREATGSVLLEAMAKGLPIITIGRFGGSVLLDNNCSYLYDGNSLEQFREGLKSAILNAAADREKKATISAELTCRAKKQIWESKLELYNSIYEKITCTEENICKL